jgi:hypothetical protein
MIKTSPSSMIPDSTGPESRTGSPFPSPFRGKTTSARCTVCEATLPSGRFDRRRTILSATATASGPLNRTMPIPPSPTGVATPQIVSSRAPFIDTHHSPARFNPNTGTKYCQVLRPMGKTRLFLLGVFNNGGHLLAARNIKPFRHQLLSDVQGIEGHPI